LIGKPASIIILSLLVVSALALAHNVQPAKATDTDWWPMFHHDLTHTGYSTSPAPTTNQTLWNYTTGYYVYSSPAVADGTVFVGSCDYKVYALNAASGLPIWNYTTSEIVESSPAVADGVVYVGSYDNKVYALNEATGAPIWNYTTTYTIGGWVESSVAVADGVVYVGSNDNKVYALNAATGASIWNYTTGGSVASSPVVVGGVVYVGSEDHKIYAFSSGPPVPEFLPYLVLPLFAATALLAALVFRRKRKITRNQASTQALGSAMLS